MKVQYIFPAESANMIESFRLSFGGEIKKNGEIKCRWGEDTSGYFLFPY